MKLHQLRFDDPSQERRYQDSIEGNLILQMRLGLLAPAILYLVYGLLLDAYILPPFAHVPVSVIHATQSVFLLAVVLSFLYFRTIRYHRIMVALAVMVAWTNHLIVIALSGETIYLGEGYLMVIWVWLVSGLNVRCATWVMAFFLVELLVYVVLADPPMKSLAGQLFFLADAGIFGVLGLFLLDYHRRKYFIAMEKSQLMEAQFLQAQKMEAIGTLVGGVAHEFNNMLAGITGNAFLARGKVKGRPEVLERLNAIDTIAFRAGEMIQHMLTFARKGRVRMEPVCLNTILDETILFIRPSLPSSLDLEIDSGEEDFLVHGDTNMLQHLLVNLINNARDATEGMEHPHVQIRMRRFDAAKTWLARHPGLSGKAFVCLSVCDNGSGLDVGEQHRIFEPFYTTKEVGKGTGLGLSMVYGAIQTHHGTIEVDSSAGAGTEFSIYLPILKDKPIKTFSQSVKKPLHGHGESILLVDDDSQLLDTSRQVLESLGFHVLLATDGLEAIEQVKQHDQIALTVMDLVMPRLGGVEAVRRIRQICPFMKVVFVTGYDIEEQLKLTLDTNSEVALSKPYHVEDLARQIRFLLNGRESSSR